MLQFVWPGLFGFLARRCAERCSAKGSGAMDGGNWGIKAVCGMEQGATLLLGNWLTRRGLRNLSSAPGGLIMIQTAAVVIDKPDEAWRRNKTRLRQCRLGTDARRRRGGRGGGREGGKDEGVRLLVVQVQVVQAQQSVVEPGPPKRAARAAALVTVKDRREASTLTQRLLPGSPGSPGSPALRARRTLRALCECLYECLYEYVACA